MRLASDEAGLALDRARAGDPSAIEDLLGAVRPMILNAAERQLAGWRAPLADSAEDVAQLALVRIARNLPACRAASPFQFIAWVMAITRRVVLDVRREPLGEHALIWRSLEQVSTSSRGGHMLAIDPNELDEEIVGSTAIATILRATRDAYAELGTVAAELLWRRVVVGETWEEVAAAMRIQPSAAKRRYQRVQRMLRREAMRRLESLPADARESARALVRAWVS